MRRNKKFLHGFSMIEIMIVVAIVTILSTLAIPSYQHYIRKARFAEIITAVQPYKTSIALALQEGFNLQELITGKHGIPISPKSTANLESINVENGIITAVASKLLDNTTYILKPDAEGTNWHTSGTCIKNNLCST